MRCFVCCLSAGLLLDTGGRAAGQYPGEGAALLAKITVPEKLVISEEGCRFGGDLRIGDLDNDGSVDFLIYRAAATWQSNQPSYLAAFTLEGTVLWEVGSGGHQPNRPGPVAVCDIDRDGETEVICLFAPDTTAVEEFSMKNTTFMIIDGKSGNIEKQHSIPQVEQSSGKGGKWIHQRIIIARLRPTDKAQDFIIKLGMKVFAIDQDLNLLWQYNIPNYHNTHPGYTPAVGDMNGDGRDEVNGGYYLLSPDGKPYWERNLGPEMDCTLITKWDSLNRAFCSGHGFVMGLHGDTIIHLGGELVPHGQELRVADFIPDVPGQEMAIRHKGHNRSLIIVGQEGRVISSFKLNPSPNNTGMTELFWNGPGKQAFLFNGGMLWDCDGTVVDSLKVLEKPPQGYWRQGWYHCLPADLAGDEGEEFVAYNPWTDEIHIFGKPSDRGKPFKLYLHTARQYNPRIMD